MQQKNNDTVNKSLQGLLNESSFDTVLASSKKHLYPSSRRFFFLILSLGILLYLFICSDITDLYKNVPSLIDKSNAVILALLAIVITGYTIFQAMLSTETLYTFLSNHENQKSIFLNYHHFFFSLSFLYIFILVIDYIFLSIITLFPDILSILNSVLLKIILAIYIIFILNAIIEMKCFLYNIYQTLSISAIAKMIDLLKKQP